MIKLNKRNIYLFLFAILYLCVAFVSTLHAISFFNLANIGWMAIILACTFEIGQAAVLYSILTSKVKKVMPWCLMTVLTLVQILGNVFSSYKYIMTNSIEDLKYFKEPIFVWTDLPDNVTTVIVTYIIGAILPVVALCLTSMVTNYINEEDNSEPSASPEPEIKEVEKIVEVPVEVEKIVEKEVPVEVIKEVEVPVEVEKIVEKEVPVEVIKEVEVPVEVEKIVEKEVPVEKEVYVDNPEHIEKINKLQETIEELKNKENTLGTPEKTKQSHFINL